MYWETLTESAIWAKHVTSRKQEMERLEKKDMYRRFCVSYQAFYNFKLWTNITDLFLMIV